MQVSKLAKKSKWLLTRWIAMVHCWQTPGWLLANASLPTKYMFYSNKKTTLLVWPLLTLIRWHLIIWNKFLRQEIMQNNNQEKYVFSIPRLLSTAWTASYNTFELDSVYTTKTRRSFRAAFPTSRNWRQETKLHLTVNLLHDSNVIVLSFGQYNLKLESTLSRADIIASGIKYTCSLFQAPI